MLYHIISYHTERASNGFFHLAARTAGGEHASTMNAHLEDDEKRRLEPHEWNG